MPNQDAVIARKVGLRFVLWGVLGAFAVTSLIFKGPYDAALFAAFFPIQILVSVVTLAAIAWFTAPLLARPIMRWGALFSAPAAVISFLVAALAGTVVNLLVSARPEDLEPVHDYLVEPMLILAVSGAPLAAVIGAFLRRSLSQAGYGSGAA